MRHLKKRLKLNRTSAHRKAMLANMASSLITYERIQTTDAKARALRPFVEKLVTLAKRHAQKKADNPGGHGDLHARRVVLSRLRDKEATAKLFSSVAPRFLDRPGGYTRIVKVGRRGGDAAPMSIIEFVGTTLEDAMEARGMADEYVEPAVFDDTTDSVDEPADSVDEAEESLDDAPESVDEEDEADEPEVEDTDDDSDDDDGDDDDGGDDDDDDDDTDTDAQAGDDEEEKKDD